MGNPNRMKYQTGETLANEIRQSKPKFAIVVEGDSDISFYRYMTISGACEFFDAGGKENLLKAIEIINSDAANKFLYLGIVDADFDVIENAYSSPDYPDYVYYTDCHDMEVMCLVPDVWEKIHNEYFAEKKKISLEELKDRVKEDASTLAYLHLANKREQWGMSIKSGKSDEDYMAVSKLYDKKTFQMLPYEDVAFRVNSNRPVKNFVAADVSKKMNEIKDENHDENQLLNGHHISLILVEYMKHFGKHVNTYNHDSVGKDIRMAYTVDHFHSTKLYTELRDFQEAKGIVFLK